MWTSNQEETRNRKRGGGGREREREKKNCKTMKRGQRLFVDKVGFGLGVTVVGLRVCVLTFWFALDFRSGWSRWIWILFRPTLS